MENEERNPMMELGTVEGAVSPRFMTFVKNFMSCGNILCGQELTYLLLFAVVRLMLGAISNSIVVRVAKALVLFLYPYMGDFVGSFLASNGISIGKR